MALLKQAPAEASAMDWKKINVVFTNGTVVREDGSVYIYYASSDIRFYVATSIIDRLLDYAFHNSSDPLRSSDCVKQRCELINRNFAFIKGESGC